MLAAAVFIVPLWCIYHKLLFHSWKRTMIYMVFSFYLTALFALVGFPNVISLRIGFTVNILPFADMAADFKNACLNILLFVPFGFFLPILWDRFRKIENAAVMGLLTSLCIELSQIFTLRTTDINDLITNTIGTIIGYLIARWITGKFTRQILLHTKISDFYMICGTVAVIMFFFQPFISLWLWEMVL